MWLRSPATFESKVEGNEALPLMKLRLQYGVEKRFSYASMELLEKYHWPGNVRELISITTMVVLGMLMTQFIVSCEDPPSGPDKNCGSGNVSYDQKTGICRDLTDNSILPVNCCL